MKSRLHIVLSLLVLGACSSEVRIVDLQGVSEASVFLVHLDADEKPKLIDGPFEVDRDGLIRGGMKTAPAFVESTEALIISHEALEDFTAAADISPKERIRFRRNARCRMQGECPLSLERLKPQGRLEERRFSPGESTGMLRGSIPPEVLVDRSITPDWLTDLTLGAPYDLELVETERLRHFGAVTQWARSSDVEGLQDFLPVNSDQVVLAGSRQICLVNESTPLEDVCAPGPRTIDVSDVENVDAPGNFKRLAQRPQGGGPIYAVARTSDDVVGYIIRFEVTENGLENLQTVTATSSLVSILRQIAVSENGILAASIETRGRTVGGYLSILQIAPDGTEETQIARGNQPGRSNDEVADAKLVATGIEETPFAMGTKNAYHLFDQSYGGWRNEDFRQQDPTSLPVKGIAALKDNFDQFVWTGHNDGVVLRHTFGARLGSPDVKLVMPDEFAEECEPRIATNGNLLSFDIRDLYVRGSRDGFALSEGCEALIWFDPTAVNLDQPHVSVFAGDRLGEPWTEFGADVADFRIRVFGDEIWVANDGALLRVRQPALRIGAE